MEKVLITGATGQLGKEVVRLLLNKVEGKNISILVRDPQKAELFKKAGIRINQGDYNNYSSLVKAFAGQDKIFFISSSDLNDRLKQHENVVKAAIEAKVGHIIYTSFQRKNETESSPIWLLASAHIATEKLIKSSGITYTILKNGLYADFLPVLLGENVINTGAIYLPAGDGKASFTLRSDLAAGSVEIITGKGHENKIYEFCSDKSYTLSDIAAHISKISGKQISYVSPSINEYKETLAKAGVPEIYIGMFAGSATAIKQGEFDNNDKTLNQMLGGKCTDLMEYLSTVYKN